MNYGSKEKKEKKKQETTPRRELTEKNAKGCRDQWEKCENSCELAQLFDYFDDQTLRKVKGSKVLVIAVY